MLFFILGEERSQQPLLNLNTRCIVDQQDKIQLL